MTETLKSVLSAFSKIRSIDELPYWQQEARKLLAEIEKTPIHQIAWIDVPGKGRVKVNLLNKVGECWGVRWPDGSFGVVEESRFYGE